MLETERLRFRPFTLDDLPWLIEMRAPEPVNRYLGGAIIVTAVVVTVMWLLGADPWRLFRSAAVVFSIIALAANTRWGWVAQERFAEQLSDWWRVVRVNMLPGLVAWILGGFRWLANWFERRLYSVDEWLRYRSGDSSGSTR